MSAWIFPAFAVVAAAAFLLGGGERPPREFDPQAALACQNLYEQRALNRAGDPLGQAIYEAKARRFAALAQTSEKRAGPGGATTADCALIDASGVTAGILRPQYVGRNHF